MADAALCLSAKEPGRIDVELAFCGETGQLTRMLERLDQAKMFI
jgi:hypothetical protein